MKKPITKSKAKKQAWKVFSEYIRKQHSMNSNSAEINFNDMVECYTCGKALGIKEAQAGHGIAGRNNAVLFNEDLVRPQCVGCNVFGGGKYSVFTQRLIEEHGSEKYYELVKQSNQTVQYKTSDYLEIKEKYKKKLEDLQP